ncbi:MAG: Rieske 2Fe-2S domain-containing protein [Pigmentiphaga sp.]|nr:Rieske 2Fe-2S domain-containing protein [Pigmentiphaga sp.]
MHASSPAAPCPSPLLAWPAEGYTRAPYRIYVDPDVYAREQEAIFRGSSWHYLGLEAEIPDPGCYKTTYIGDLPVLVTRAEDGSVHAMLNRCSHRGNLVAREPFGKAKRLYCVYHAWSFNLRGELTAAAFRHGLRGEGGLPDDFDLADHGLRRLRTTTFLGLVFATFDNSLEPLEDWLGEVADGMRRVLRKPLKVLGYDTQRIHANWKMYHENPRDSYHANILHTFYATFGLSRQSQESGMILDGHGRHVYFYTKANTETASSDFDQATTGLRSVNSAFKLEDPGLLAWRDEHGDGVSVQILTAYPTFVLHQIANSLATRQLVPRGPGQADLVWTYFGYADDDDEMTRLRLAQINLVGSAGMVSVEDAAVCEMIAKAIGDGRLGASFIEMGGRDLQGASATKLSERAIRNFWNIYRQDMGL